jgi:hypothetical protein
LNIFGYKIICNYYNVGKYTGKAVTIFGEVCYFKDGRLHRENGPAITHLNGSYKWCLNGEKHRIDGPAVYSKDMVKEWWVNGNLHRTDGPAIEHDNGNKFWYVNGMCHREDGPAVEYVDSSREWWLNGKLHREDGPAIEYVDGSKSWIQTSNVVHSICDTKYALNGVIYDKDPMDQPWTNESWKSFVKIQLF